MKLFAQLFNEVDQTTKTNEKVAALVRYFAAASEVDTLWCIALLSGNSPKRTVKSGQLKEWCAAAAGLPYWLFDESYHIVGDLAETVTLSLPEPTTIVDYTLSETIAFLNSLAKAADEEKCLAIQGRWTELDKESCFLFNKLITGGFRMGVSKQLIIRALSIRYKLAEDTIAHRLTGDWQPTKTNIQDLLLGAETQENYYRPYPFYLAYQLDQPLDTLGSISDWQLERKYDGIRGQLIKRRGELFIWSRGEELMTDKFIEFHMLKELLPDGTVIDGEVLPYRDSKALPFHLMQTRIGRKNVTKKSLIDAPLVMMCYDLLELDGIDIRSESMAKRRAKLEQLVGSIQSLNGVHIPLRISPILACDSWEAAAEQRMLARELGCEGLMIKHRDSPYETGRKRGQWWKWKVDPLTIDGVLVYAQSGHGRRANLYTDYTFAVWDGDSLVPFTKAYSGLTDKELIEIDGWIKKHTLEKFGPVRSVTPELVFELAFEGINLSSRHKSGVALRFPRILRWRKDKKKEEANTKADLMALIASMA